ncbi:MAG: hypothetical protein JWP87_6023 [Labilithrix sp.]|nr:hypothetical protein [Labilithrix sp.]
MPLAFDLDRYVAQIRSFDGERFAVATEVTMPYRGRAHPVLSVRSRAVASKTLLVLAGVHGDERAGNPSRMADEAARLRPHVDLVAAVAERVTGWDG